jgi:hypothetical protein
VRPWVTNRFERSLSLAPRGENGGRDGGSEDYEPKCSHGLCDFQRFSVRHKPLSCDSGKRAPRRSDGIFVKEAPKIWTCEQEFGTAPIARQRVKLPELEFKPARPAAQHVVWTMAAETSPHRAAIRTHQLNAQHPHPIELLCARPTIERSSETPLMSTWREDALVALQRSGLGVGPSPIRKSAIRSTVLAPDCRDSHERRCDYGPWGTTYTSSQQSVWAARPEPRVAG